MKEAGWALVAVAAMALMGGMMIDVSVTTPYIPGGAYTPSVAPQSVANIHKMHVQSLVIQGSFVAFLAGIVLVGCGTIADRLGPPRGAEAGGSNGTVSGAAVAEASSEPTEPAAPREPNALEAGSSKEVAGIMMFLFGLFIVIGIIVVIANVATGGSGSSSDANNTIDLNVMDTDVFNTTDINATIEEADRALREAENALR